MKRVIPFFVIIVAVLLLSSFAMAEEIGYVVDARGIVEVMHNGAKDWKPATAKTLLYLDDSVRTGDQSEAKIVFNDGSVLNLGSSSKVKITDDGPATAICKATLATIVERKDGAGGSSEGVSCGAKAAVGGGAEPLTAL